MPNSAHQSLAMSHPSVHKSCRFILKICLLGILFLPLHLLAQTGLATLSGTVTDQSGALVPNARVTVTNEDNGATVKGETTRAGVYDIEALKPGRYRVTVEHQGFKQVEVLNLELHTQDVVSRNFTLSVGASSETIQVNAANMQMDTTNPGVGLLVDRDFVENMPLNGRSFQDLISLAPGVMDAGNGGNGNSDGGLFTVNGQRGEANYYTVDGVSANVQAGNSVGVAGVQPSQTALGTTQSLLSVDALQEFKIQTSGYSAEYGRQPGGQIQLTTRSGTNGYHGSVFDYFRNEAMDANLWLFNYNDIPRQAERQNDFGGTFGGPAWIPHLYNGKNRTFFFFSYEGLRLLQPNFTEETVPTVAFRQFAASVFQPYFNALPLPTPGQPDNADPCAVQLNPSYTFACSAPFAQGVSNPSSLDSTLVRVDQMIGDRLQLFFTYKNAPSTSGQISGSQFNGGSDSTSAWTAGSTWRISNTLVDELRLNWLSATGGSDVHPVAVGGAVPWSRNSLVPAQYQGSAGGAMISFGTIDSPSYQESFGPPGYLMQNVGSDQFNLIDGLTWTRGAHSIKFGGDLRRLHSTVDGDTYSVNVGAYTAADVQQGIIDGVATQIYKVGQPVFTNLSLYAEDSWKLGRRFTLDYGVRWEFNPVPGAVDGVYPLAITTANPAAMQLAPPGTPLYHTQYKDFAPRVGFADQANSSQNHPLVVRGGFGIFYATGQDAAAGGYQGWPFYANQSSYPISVPFPVPASLLTPPDLPELTPPYPAISLIDPHLAVPYTEEWNLSLSEGLSARNIFTMNYVGNTGKKLIYTWNYGDLAAVNPLFTGVGLTTNASSSKYNALQLQDQGYVGRHLQLIGAYTWAHAEDNASSESTAFPPIWGNSDNDVRQRFDTSLIYSIPGNPENRILRTLVGGWSLSSRFNAQTGIPVYIVQGYYSLPPIGQFGAVIPDRVPGVPVILHNQPGEPFGWALNPAAFSLVALNPDGSPVQQGNLPRNDIHGPAFWNLDSAAQKQSPLTERLNLLFRVDAFNILNHPNPGQPDPCLCDGSSFGIINGGSVAHGIQNALYAFGSPRSLQASLKLQF